MAKYLSINRKKVKVSKSVNGLVQEYFRNEKNAEKFVDGHRQIDVHKTKENVILYHSRSNNLDQARRQSIKIVNQKRAQRPDDFVLRSAYPSKKSYQSALNAARRKLRKDGVDIVTSVVQPSADFINQFGRDQQVKFFQDCLDVMNQDRETYGRTLAAVIHFDENTPHMQVISSTISLQTLNFMTKKMFGNKTKMSQDQTRFVQAVQSKGWEVERGLQRVNNPEYQNFKTEAERQGLQVNRFTDQKILQAEQTIKKARLEQEKANQLAEDSQNELLKLEHKQKKLDKQVTETQSLVDKVSDDLDPQSKALRNFRFSLDVGSGVAVNPFKISLEVLLNVVKDFKKQFKKLQEELSARSQDLFHL